ncbi:MAG TPA: chloride channel protein [Candidatus Dormibacteraeota bacterium]|nr:chloride channel protein [Candidatus Dormibacteraeota bacterium]
MALAVGAGAGLGAIGFRALIALFTRAFSGHDDYSAAGHAPNPSVPALGIWFVVLAPVVGGLIYGPLVDHFAREARGHGVPEVMHAVAERGGRIRPQVAVVKSLASASCIGSGGSVGREGPIVQIGSALGSTVGQVMRVPESRLRILVACGAAGGISATFNAPIAGVFFALELILQDFAAESFGVVVLASVAAAAIGRAAFGSAAFLTLPAFHLASNAEYLLYAALGVLAAFAGIAFVRVLYGAEDLADRLWHGPEWARPAVGGVLLGLLLLAVPQMYGVGYPVLEDAIRGNDVLWFLVALLAAKMAATSITIAIGGSGGVFAPSLFMGAMLGAAFGQAAAHIVPGASPGAYGIVGMGAVFAAAARAPITAVLIIFELTGDYAVILPLMSAIVLSAGVSNLLSRDTIYTLKLRRRGIDLQRGRTANLMQVISAGEAMRPLPPALSPETSLDELTARLLDEHMDALPVVDADGAYRGTVTAQGVEQAMRDGALDAVAADLAEETATLTTSDSLERALSAIVGLDRAGVPVLDRPGGHLVGWLTQRDVLLAYHRHLHGGAVEARGRFETGARPRAAL